MVSLVAGEKSSARELENHLRTEHLRVSVDHLLQALGPQVEMAMPGMVTVSFCSGIGLLREPRVGFASTAERVGVLGPVADQPTEECKRTEDGPLNEQRRAGEV